MIVQIIGQIIDRSTPVIMALHLIHVYNPSTVLRLSNRTNAMHFSGFCLQVFRQAGPL